MRGEAWSLGLTGGGGGWGEGGRVRGVEGLRGQSGLLKQVGVMRSCIPA